MNSQEVINILKKNGWTLSRINGSHHIFEDADGTRHTTVPHPRKDMSKRTLSSICRQSGIKLRIR